MGFKYQIKIGRMMIYSHSFGSFMKEILRSSWILLSSSKPYKLTITIIARLFVYLAMLTLSIYSLLMLWRVLI